MAPLVEQVNRDNGLKPGHMMLVCSHTHSGPVLHGVIENVYSMGPHDHEVVADYSAELKEKIAQTVRNALADLKPAKLERGHGRAAFAMNRRVYQGDKVVFGENPDGPVDWDVDVLKISGTNGAPRAIVFGYACHGTSIGGAEFYTVSGDYMAYARDYLETNFPGATALYLTGMGADSNPSPRGKLIYAKQHGLELAGAVAGALAHPLEPVNGNLSLAYAEVELPLEPPPPREKMETQAKAKEQYVRARAQTYLKKIENGEPLPQSVRLPLAAVRIGPDLAFICMGGEDVVDYSKKFKRLFASEHPWLIGYAYEIPCYIPSIRLLKEGGYETEDNLMLYGYYGPFRTSIEGILTGKMTELVNQIRAKQN
jgi:neutral ceramidase